MTYDKITNIIRNMNKSFYESFQLSYDDCVLKL
nr:MAG TPA: Calcyclin-binding protein [Bacteriophage sp.]